MDTLDLMSILEQTGFSGSMLCQSSLGISPDRIRENVILSPGWPPEKLEHLGKPVQIVSSGPLYGYAVWDICLDGLTVTLLKTGFGAPVVLDAMLVLRSTPCKRVLFVSSVGGLDEKMQVGDLVVPVSSMSGDGASRYINPNGLAEDRMGRKAFPDPAFLQLVQEETERICREEGIAWHEESLSVPIPFWPSLPIWTKSVPVAAIHWIWNRLLPLRLAGCWVSPLRHFSMFLIMYSIKSRPCRESASSRMRSAAVLFVDR